MQIFGSFNLVTMYVTHRKISCARVQKEDPSFVLSANKTGRTDLTGREIVYTRKKLGRILR